MEIVEQFRSIDPDNGQRKLNQLAFGEPFRHPEGTDIYIKVQAPMGSDIQTAFHHIPSGMHTVALNLNNNCLYTYFDTKKVVPVSARIEYTGDLWPNESVSSKAGIVRSSKPKPSETSVQELFDTDGQKTLWVDGEHDGTSKHLRTYVYKDMEGHEKWIASPNPYQANVQADRHRWQWVGEGTRDSHHTSNAGWSNDEFREYGYDVVIRPLRTRLLDKVYRVYTLRSEDQQHIYGPKQE